MKFAVWGALLLCLSMNLPVAGEAQSSSASAEATALLEREAKESGRPAYTPENGVVFKPSDHVYIKSALAIDFTYRRATVTLPIFRGIQGDGKTVYYIITDASDYDVAQAMGIDYSPKLAKAAGTPGAQRVTLTDGVMHFEGSVDFSPVYKVAAGPPPVYFPPKAANPERPATRSGRRSWCCRAGSF